RDGLAAAFRAAAEQIIAGNAVIIRNLYDKFQPAFTDAFFIMGKLRLADPQVSRRLLLGNAPLLAQQGDDAVEFHRHLFVRPSHQSPPRALAVPGGIYALLIISAKKRFVKTVFAPFRHSAHTFLYRGACENKMWAAGKYWGCKYCAPKRAAPRAAAELS